MAEYTTIDDTLAYFSNEANKHPLLKHELEISYGKQLFSCKKELISKLSDLNYEGCLVQRLQQISEGTVADRTYAIIRPTNADEPTRTRLKRCIKKVQEISGQKNTAAKEKRHAALNKLSYTRRFINDVLKDLKDQYESGELKKYKNKIQEIKTLHEKYEETYRSLFNANLRLVRSIANRYRNRKGMEIGDILNEGCTGLMTAVDKYDYRRGFKFSTFATNWIKQAITRAFQEKSRTIRIPVHIIDKLVKIKTAKKELIRKGKQATADEISAATSIPAKEIESLGKVYTKNPLSLNAQSVYDGEEGSPFSESVIDKSSRDPCKNAIQENLKERIQEVINDLKPREKIAIVLRYGLDGKPPQKLEETGKALHVTRERARQLQNAATRKLQHPIRSRKLESFLDRASSCESQKKP